MKQERQYQAAVVSRKAEKSLHDGHLWVYAEEIVRGDTAAFENGAPTDVLSENGRYLGTGFYSAASKIAVRLFSHNASDTFDAEFWRRRVRYALNYRLRVMKDDFGACRLIFGDADGFPGLTVDKYGDYLAAEVLSFGMDRIKDTVFNALCEELYVMCGIRVRGIYERNESRIRLLEGLDQSSGWARGIPNDGRTSTTIEENGIRYLVDFAGGQKTGYFLDQKYNRRAVAALAAGRRVLDLCTHTGSFALNALRGGAASVTAVDVSEAALDVARANAALNGLEAGINFVCADIFDYLPRLEGLRPEERFDLIVLDPPAFTKSSKTLGNARKGYREVNYRAMKALPRGGFLATCSCSHFMTTELFLDVLKAAAADAGVALRIAEIRHQAPDHPVLLTMPETDYLKFVICQVV